ncbi:Hypothetical protein BN69_0391 [Methylocystis sp. SC2]|nr:Hypothetical protein BN69_0391 [Methylocystis sp. SC2]
MLASGKKASRPHPARASSGAIIACSPIAALPSFVAPTALMKQSRIGELALQQYSRNKPVASKSLGKVVSHHSVAVRCR